MPEPSLEREREQKETLSSFHGNHKIKTERKPLTRRKATCQPMRWFELRTYGTSLLCSSTRAWSLAHTPLRGLEHHTKNMQKKTKKKHHKISTIQCVWDEEDVVLKQPCKEARVGEDGPAKELHWAVAIIGAVVRVQVELDGAGARIQ
jgi:hypothetical protein